jgi:hypothetical protein
MSSSHEIVYYRCGHLAYQCRCPDPGGKAKHVLAALCPSCTAQQRMNGLPAGTVRKQR